MRKVVRRSVQAGRCNNRVRFTTASICSGDHTPAGRMCRPTILGRESGRMLPDPGRQSSATSDCNGTGSCVWDDQLTVLPHTKLEPLAGRSSRRFDSSSDETA